MIAPLAMLGLPLLMQLATLGIPAQISDEQVHLARLLVLLTVPQTFLYALIGTAARRDVRARRFAPALRGPGAGERRRHRRARRRRATYGQSAGSPDGSGR